MLRGSRLTHHQVLDFSSVPGRICLLASQRRSLKICTALGMMECKKARTEAGGDIELAIENLRKNSGLKAAKKAGRVAAEGAIVIKVADDASYGVMVEINSETDFVARDDNFKAFTQLIADRVFATKNTPQGARALRSV
ncbi:translation elongation factor Ts [Halomonas sp. GDM18]|nr:translation elongation factor Ts [Halomonas sp. GDM18]